MQISSNPYIKTAIANLSSTPKLINTEQSIAIAHAQATIAIAEELSIIRAILAEHFNVDVKPL